MEGDRNVVWGRAVEVEEASLLSVERAAQGRENERWPDVDRDSARLPAAALPTRPAPLCCVEQDSVPSLQPDFCEPSCFGSCPAKSWRGSELDC